MLLNGKWLSPSTAYCEHYVTYCEHCVAYCEHCVTYCEHCVTYCEHYVTYCEHYVTYFEHYVTYCEHCVTLCHVVYMLDEALMSRVLITMLPGILTVIIWRLACVLCVTHKHISNSGLPLAHS